jgi:hypothetical protein
LKIRERRTALKHSHLQVNSPLDVRWLCFDIDRSGAALAWEDADLPAPNAVVTNPANGHAHLLWCLREPVHAGVGSRASPLRFVADVETGMLRRLGADPGYSGLIVKNPKSPCWRVTWPAPFPYNLRQLNSELNREDKMRPPTASESIGLGRNCVLFDELRRHAYRDVLKAKSEGLSLANFHARTEALGHELNQQFRMTSGSGPLAVGEVRAIARSVARFTYRNFTPGRFSALQSHRAQARTRRNLSIVAEIKHART